MFLPSIKLSLGGNLNKAWKSAFLLSLSNPYLDGSVFRLGLGTKLGLVGIVGLAGKLGLGGKLGLEGRLGLGGYMEGLGGWVLDGSGIEEDES